jgi:hypothetical protein
MFPLKISFRVFLLIPPLPRCDFILSSSLRCRPLLSSPSSDLAAVCRRGPLVPCRLPCATVVSSRASVPSCFLCDIVFVLFLTPVSLAPWHLCTKDNLPAGCGQSLLRSTISLGPNFPEDVPLAPCHCCTVGHLPADGNQLPPGSRNSSAQFLWFSAPPCS